MKKTTLLVALALALSASQSTFASPGENESHERYEQNEKYEHRESREAEETRTVRSVMDGDDVLIQERDAAPAQAFKAGTTLENLQAAFNGESNAAAKYAAFARKADEEGFGGIASLFRAASRAEQIHAENHADVIRSLGGEPRADVKPVEPETTAKNLKKAVEGETFERDVMYPAYMEVARKDRNRNALRTFNYAQITESHHADFYAQASEKLLQYQDSEGVTWYVCPTCGETLRAEDFATMSKCPVCFTRTRTFEPII